jgi:hypothetical protein
MRKSTGNLQLKAAALFSTRPLKINPELCLRRASWFMAKIFTSNPAPKIPVTAKHSVRTAGLSRHKKSWRGTITKNKGLSLAVVRPANVYGPRSGPWLHDVVNVIRSGAPCLISGGKTNGRTYNAYDGLNVTWNEYFTDIAGMIGIKNLKSVPRPLATLISYVFKAIWKFLDIEKRPPVTREALNLTGSDDRIPIDRIRNELGYEPQVSYAEGLKRIKEYIDKELK